MQTQRLYHEVHAGDGPYLLLVHGNLSSRAQWLPNLEALSRVARPVVVELWGHGRSPSPEDPSLYAPESYVEQFEALRAELGIERWAVLGQSLGAALTLRYALDHPERVLAHVFTNSNSALADAEWGSTVRIGMQKWAEEIEAEGYAAIERLPIHPSKGKRLPAEIRRALVRDCERCSPRGIALGGLHTVPTSPLRNRIGENRVPSLLLAGRLEKKFQGVRDYAERVMPELDVIELDAGHAVNLEAAERFNEETTRFLIRRAGHVE